MVRSCYSADIRFYKDSDITNRVTWFFIPKGMPLLGKYTHFASGNWASERADWNGPGEVIGPRPWADGSMPLDELLTGVPKGTDEQWAGEISYGQSVSEEEHANCCGRGIIGEIALGFDPAADFFVARPERLLVGQVDILLGVEAEFNPPPPHAEYAASVTGVGRVEATSDYFVVGHGSYSGGPTAEGVIEWDSAYTPFTRSTFDLTGIGEF